MIPWPEVHRHLLLEQESERRRILHTDEIDARIEAGKLRRKDAAYEFIRGTWSGGSRGIDRSVA